MEEEELQSISQEEYLVSKENLELNKWNQRQIKLQYSSMTNFINSNDIRFLGSLQSDYNNHRQKKSNNVYNFSLLDQYPTDDSFDSCENEVIEKQPVISNLIKKQSVQKNKTEAIEMNGKEGIALQEQKTKPIPEQKPIEVNQEDQQTHTSFKIPKRKKQLLRQQMKEYEQSQDNSGLTYYQRKKNFIQQMKENDLLLDWDSYRKDDMIMEQTSIGGASRKKKYKKQIEVIELPPQQEKTNTSTTTYNNYHKEAKSYRKLPRSLKFENKFQPDGYKISEIQEERNALKINGEHKIKEDEKDIYKPFESIQMVDVDKKELLKRKEEFLHYQFLKNRKIQPNSIFISKQAQALIPQLRPIDEVRNTWVLKDLNSILAYKNSKEYEQLEEYMNKFFGKLQPWQIFNILKLNKYNVKNAIDYCNVNNDYLKSYYQFKEAERKKKPLKRRLEKKKYV